MQAPTRRRFGTPLLLAFLTSHALQAAAVTHVVQNTPQLKAALDTLRPGDTLLIDSGTYAGGHRAIRLAGTPGAPITIRGADPKSPPVFQTGREAFHFSSIAYLRLQHLQLQAFPDNGIRIDDNGDANTPSHHVIIEHVTIRDTGPVGDKDAIKLTGVDDFIVRHCRFEGWGGAAIDMAGCQRGFVDDCVFIGQERSDQTQGIAIGGGSSNVLIQSSYLRWAGLHAISIGGNTAAERFRPRDAAYEATDITIAGNRILGGPCPILWSSADGGHVHHNTLILPHRWVARILQENEDPRIAPCRNGVFEQNVVLYDQRVFTIVNRTEYTDAESFVFRSNAWHRTVGPRPLRLPGKEFDSVLQVNPNIAVEGPQAMRVTATDPRLAGLGADPYTPAPAPFSLP